MIHPYKTLYGRDLNQVQYYLIVPNLEELKSNFTIGMSELYIGTLKGFPAQEEWDIHDFSEN